MLFKNLKHLSGPLRLPFLALTPVCILLGYETAVLASEQINHFHFILVLSAAISAHISVNTFNEYLDYQSGLDFKTTRTAFSGGSGSLVHKPELAPYTLIIAWLTFAITCLIGIYFIYLLGPAILPIGLAGLFVILAYTNWLTRHPIFCLITPGLAFGPLMVVGTHLILTGEYSFMAFVVSLIPFFLVNNLLLLNQYPDIEADRSIGRKTLPIAFGKNISNHVYTLFLFLTYSALSLSVYFGQLSTGSLLGLLSVMIAVPTLVGVYRLSGDIKGLTPYLGLNVGITILTPALISMGLHFG